MAIRMFFILTLFFFGCSKQKTSVPQHLVGKYEWYYTMIDENTIYSRNDTSHRFGIKITKDGRVITFHDGKVHSKGIVRKVSDTVIYLDLNNENSQLNILSDGVTSESFPSKAILNKFKKQ